MSTGGIPADHRALAAAVAEDDADWSDPETAAVRLHHAVLPALDDAGLLASEPGDDHVRLE